MNTWQPIETAPKDGTFIITVVDTCQDCRPAIMAWQCHHDKCRFGPDPEDFMEESHFDEYWRGCDYQPTHWMPLPKQPSSEDVA